MCAPERIEIPTASASSWIAVSTICSGRLVEARVDDLHARVAERARDDLRAAVVPVEAGLRDHHSDLPRPRLRKYMSVKLTVVGCSPAWPNPGGAQSGYLARGRRHACCSTAGPGVLARLREREAVAAPSTRSRSRTSTSTTGATSCRGSGATTFGPGARRADSRSSGCRRAAARCSRSSASSSARRRCSRTRSGCAEYAERRAVRGRRASRSLPAARAALRPARLRRSAARANGTTLAYSGDCGPCDELAELAARRRPLPLRGDAARAEPGGRDARAPRAPTRRSRPSRPRGAKRLLLTHRPHERPLDAGLRAGLRRARARGRASGATGSAGTGTITRGDHSFTSHLPSCLTQADPEDLALDAGPVLRQQRDLRARPRPRTTPRSRSSACRARLGGIRLDRDVARQPFLHRAACARRSRGAASPRRAASTPCVRFVCSVRVRARRAGRP